MLSTRVKILCSFSVISKLHGKLYTGNVQQLILIKLSSFSVLKIGKCGKIIL